MELNYTAAYMTAMEDFQNARRTAMISSILATLRGRKSRLLSFEEVRKSLKLESTSNRNYLAEIPLDAIIGSVNRYQDFTRDFLPKKNSTAERWAKVSAAIQQMESLPPIDVFKVGEVYFVNDGNHRVSVARQMGNTTIQAYVTEISTRVPLYPDQKPEDLIIKAEEAEFLEFTRLDILRPGANFSATAPEAYSKLREHIAVHNYYLNVGQGREVPKEEATLHWYDTHFLPTINLIQNSGLLREFPNKTPVDLYIWLIDHKEALERGLGKKVQLPAAAQDIIVQHGPSFERVANRIIEAVLPDGLEGQITKLPQTEGHSQELPQQTNLFKDILVPIDGRSEQWFALDQAMIIAKKENSHLYGLHITPNSDTATTQEMVSKFSESCHRNGIAGELHLAQGETARIISYQAAWQDLIIINLAYRPGASPLSRLTHGFRIIMQRSPRPVLAVPQTVSELRHALIAYDGSPGAREALYVATYVAGKWGTQISVLTVSKGKQRIAEKISADGLDYVRSRGIKANGIISSLPVSQGILTSAQEINADLIIMGGFSSPPLQGILLDSIADQILRESQIPMLLCR